mgnify:CR=1 FL=1
MSMSIKNITRRGKYNLMADEKLELLMEDTIPFGKWGHFDKIVANLSRNRKKKYGGRMRDHQRLIARQLIKAMRKQTAPKILFEVFDIPQKTKRKAA